jgi:hypothetical protein
VTVSTTVDALIESQVDHLFLIFTDFDLSDPERFAAWKSTLSGAVPAELVWGDRLVMDPDQRPGESPRWRHMVVAGVKGGAELATRVIASFGGSRSHGVPDFAVWAYEAVGDFVTKSDGLPGSPSKATLAPGAYRTSDETEARR